MAPTARVPCPNCCLSADRWMIEEGGLCSKPPNSLPIWSRRIIADSVPNNVIAQISAADRALYSGAFAARPSVLRGSATVDTSPRRVTCSLSASSTAWNCTCATLANIRMYSTSRTEAS